MVGNKISSPFLKDLFKHFQGHYRKKTLLQLINTNIIFPTPTYKNITKKATK